MASSVIHFDGERLTRRPPGRRFRADSRCLGAGERAFAHVCALADPAALLPFDTPEVQQVRRDALAWWISLLGDELVCVTTLAVDAVNYGGAITVARSPDRFRDDPFARISPAPSSRPMSSCRSRRRPARRSSATAAPRGPAAASRNESAFAVTDAA